jgi:hypothetical protein
VVSDMTLDYLEELQDAIDALNIICIGLDTWDEREDKIAIELNMQIIALNNVLDSLRRR